MASKSSRLPAGNLRICCSAISVANRRTSHGTFLCLARLMSSRQKSFCRPRTAAATARLFLTAFALTATIFAVFALLAFVFLFLLLLLWSWQSAERDHERSVERLGTVSLENDGYCVGPRTAVALILALAFPLFSFSAFARHMTVPPSVSEFQSSISGSAVYGLPPPAPGLSGFLRNRSTSGFCLRGARGSPKAVACTWHSALVHWAVSTLGHSAGIERGRGPRRRAK